MKPLTLAELAVKVSERQLEEKQAGRSLAWLMKRGYVILRTDGRVVRTERGAAMLNGFAKEYNEGRLYPWVKPDGAIIYPVYDERGRILHVRR